LPTPWLPDLPHGVGNGRSYSPCSSDANRLASEFKTPHLKGLPTEAPPSTPYFIKGNA